ncbi:MAG: serine protein kinase [Deltaproteobacteria bacterium RIFCSPLOWO2_12_FULL_40_28]|nr:MAG: serine protein kinase [Deltaproteobacteria bacterium RIFCSPHIGHO2_02_FULL_40_28]OGQ18796.1 MAG: serine protein kinase [Deltaproteobacteria bacterium RIFCSPHIGHO2_12_FULL_40_32]OGQ40041.1 MAG: serine protein kinase [Deltaproteobacteria bacterium RIFCSPLOWO2_02_FULL_40_36]OGQ53224.1 MAG: serine protein kinase [Deltaproteobacteria bacterium RIFCSPLOWO2_12_FULL_40_28]
MISTKQLVEMINDSEEVRHFRDLNWVGSLQDYLQIFIQNPKVSRSAYQRLYDMVLSFGTEEYKEYKKNITKYQFFGDPYDDGKDAVYGIDLHLMKLVNVIKAAALRYGPEKRVILLHGPVGSSKSTIVRLLKKGVEDYSRKPEGALYSFRWTKGETGNKAIDRLFGSADLIKDPIHAEPLYLIPPHVREKLLDTVNKNLSESERIILDGDLSPISRFIYNELFNIYEGNWEKVISHIEVYRMVMSEKDRIGVGTFQPRDEKNQDSTELTGDINYRKIAEYGSESDPRAFNFDGEFNIANRGIIEFVEMLKLDVAFLYDLLGASQEHKVKPKKFAQTHIDEVIIGHTNEPEYRKLQSNEYMEALRDRTIKIDIPYITRISQEKRIYEKDFTNEKVKGKHIAPHTVEVAAMWAVLTRLEEPKKASLTLLQKLKLYDGKTMPGFTEDNVKELRKEGVREGLEGISPRYVQDKISNALVSSLGTSINPFMVLNELESGLKHHSLIATEDIRKKYREIFAVVKEEYENIVKNEVQRAITADEDALSRLCSNYIDNVKAYTQREKVKNKFTGQDEEPDERLMRSIEEKIDIPDSRKEDFRREIMNYIGALSLEGKKFDYKTNERLYKALELKLFEDQKDSIKLSSLVSNTVDAQTQEKIDVVKARLIKNYGYNDESATDVLNYVASIFARGDIKEKN